MILDALATLSTAQTTTTSVASTDIIDTVAKGDSYQGCWFVVQVSTAFTTSTTTPTFTFQLQTSDAETFLSATAYTLVQSAAFLASELTAGKFWAVRIPQNTRRYIRGYKSVSVNTGANYVTANGYNMYIVADIDSMIGTKRYMLP